MKERWRFWGFTVLIWLIATCIDRYWWQNHNGLPAWDQADYLNSALDHGRALGMLPGGEWQGWKALLDLSPKIPPLASLVNGSVIAIAGDEPNQAAWSLSIWNGLLLASVAGWGLHLQGAKLGLLGVAFVAIAPALLQLRSDYVLELPLTAMVTLAIWRLGCWSHPHSGGGWRQALIAACTCTAAILIKQSALLPLFPALTWASLRALSNQQAAKLQLVVGLGVFALGILPWFHHNWITTIGGTNRAVIESAIREGDPSLLTLENWIWYPRLLIGQIGPVLLLVGLSGCVLWILMQCRSGLNDPKKKNHNDNYEAWKWLVFTLFAGWICTSLSPNKDDRYIAPLLPALLLCLARGWFQWELWAKNIFPKQSRFSMLLALIGGLGMATHTTLKEHNALLTTGPKGPLQAIVEAAGGADPNKSKATVIVVPSTPDLNQHNVSYFGRRNGGQLVGRQLGNNRTDISPVLAQAKWIILAEGNQGSVRKAAGLLDEAVRNSQIFTEIQRFPRVTGGSYSLWHRRDDAPKPKSFVAQFSTLAKGLEHGPNGITPVFSKIAIQHMLDGHFLYQEQIKKSSMKKLEGSPNDINAHWNLALLAILRNRPDEAAKEFSSLQDLLPNNPWPSAYRSIVTLADWNPWGAARIADQATKQHANTVLIGLGDLNGLIGGGFWRVPSASHSIPKAIESIEKTMNNPPSEKN